MTGAGSVGRANGSGAPARVRRFRPRAKPRVRGQVRAEINVTPLVDVVLVLLIIFMVVTPMIARGVDVKLPVTTHHRKKNDDNRDIVVSIAQDGAVYVGPDLVAQHRLGVAIQEEKRRYPDKAVFLRADERLEYGQARTVMDAIHAAGFEDVQLGTDEEAH